MDLRFVAFDLIARDAELRTLLANYAGRLEPDRAPGSTATTSCFIVLTWTADERSSAPAGSELLTAQVHVSRDDSSRPVYFDWILRRLHAALTARAPNPCITVRCVTTSDEDVDGGLDTVFKTGTWAIAPVPAQRAAAALTELVPWTGYVEADAAELIASGVAALGMN